MNIDFTTAILFLAALQLVAILQLCYVIDRVAASRKQQKAESPSAQGIGKQPYSHRHVWLPRSEEATQGRRVRVSVCADPNCPERLREEVPDG